MQNKTINNKLEGNMGAGSSCYLPAINRQVLILGYSARFWQVFFVGSVPALLLGYSSGYIWVIIGIYLLIGFIFAYFGDKNTQQLEKGKYFFQQEKKYFHNKKGARIVMKGVREYL